MAVLDESQVKLLVAGFAATSILYFIGAMVYRLYFSPLSKFPGPKLWALSPVPGIVLLLKGRISFEYKIMHDKYGQAVRVGPNEISFNSAQAWNDIYGHRTGLPNMDKDPIHVGAIEPVPGATNLTMSNDTNHARQRRILSHAFSHKALLEQEPIVRGYVDKFIENLKRICKEQEAGRAQGANMVNWFNFTTFDIIGDLSFGEPFGCLAEGEGGESQQWVVLIYESIKGGAIEQATRRFSDVGSPTQRFLMWCIPDIVKERRRKHLRNSTEKTLRRMAEKTEHRDFLWYILNKRERTSDKMSDDEIIVNAALFIVAGSETTATLLSGLTNHLLRNRRCYDLLTREIRDTFKSEDELTLKNLMELPYLNACLEEGLRIFPPVPVALLRTVPKGGSTIDGHFVPEGTAVAVSSWTAAHNPFNFVDPDAFIPERWLDSRYDTDLKKGSQPFSLGPRGCIGRHLAYVEMRLIVARLFWNFDLEFAEEHSKRIWDPANESQNLRAFNTWEKPPLMCRLVSVKR